MAKINENTAPPKKYRKQGSYDETKAYQAWNAVWQQEAGAVLIAHGGVRAGRPNQWLPMEWRLLTKYGPLTVTILDFVAMRYDNPKQAAAVLNLSFNRVNPYSGKYNLDFNPATPIAARIHALRVHLEHGGARVSGLAQAFRGTHCRAPDGRFACNSRCGLPAANPLTKCKTKR